ncbi:MAG: RNA methyltransferase [archaeon]
MSLFVVLVQPHTPGNIGAIARVMANFGAKKLFLVNPKCDYLCKESLDRAKHAKHILKDAIITTLSQLKKDMHVLVATTARLGDKYNFPRIPFTPQQLAKELAHLSPRTKIGIVLGRETDGLTNEEVALCDFCVTIPTHPSYASMNVSHAAAVILSHLYLPETSIEEKYTLLTPKEKEVALKLIDAAIDGMTFPAPHMKDTQKTLWRRLIGKSFLTKREGYALMGFMKNVKK